MAQESDQTVIESIWVKYSPEPCAKVLRAWLSHAQHFFGRLRVYDEPPVRVLLMIRFTLPDGEYELNWRFSRYWPEEHVRGELNKFIEAYESLCQKRGQKPFNFRGGIDTKDASDYWAELNRLPLSERNRLILNGDMAVFSPPALHPDYQRELEEMEKLSADIARLTGVSQRRVMEKAQQAARTNAARTVDFLRSWMPKAARGEIDFLK